MASLRNRRGTWYARVQSWLDGSRIEEVNKVENDIKKEWNLTFL